jgi:predicted RNase H-like HicB family nuclease
MREYTVILHPDETGDYWTEVPALPGCGSQGETLEEAIEMTKDAIALWLESMSDRGEAIPEDRDVVVKVTMSWRA